MQIEISKVVYEKEVVDVTFPYYYKHDLMLDNCESVIFGKIVQNLEVAIQITDHFSYNLEYGIEVSRRGASTPSSYFDEKYKSTEDEFLAAKIQVATIILRA